MQKYSFISDLFLRNLIKTGAEIQYMISHASRVPHSTQYLFLTVVLVLFVIAGGCTRQASGTPETVSGLTVIKPDDSHITVAYAGAPGMDGLLELEMTFTDSDGRSLTKSSGSRLGTTPLQVHATYSVTGAYGQKSHVFITGYFSDGSHRTLYDKDI
jgi:hypothetical protein